VELLKLWTMLRRRIWLLVQAVVLFTLAGVASAVLLPKSYQATSRVMVSSSDATSAVLSDLGLQELAVGLSTESDDITNHIALATSRPVLEEVVWRLQLRDDDGKLYQAEKLVIRGALSELKAEPYLELRQHQSTDIVLITATSADPDLSRLMADTLARVYINDTRDRSRRETKEARAFVESRLEIVREEFDLAMKRIADVQEAEQIIDLDSEVRSAVGRLSELMMMAEETATRSREVQGQIEGIQAFQVQEGIDFIGPATLNENSEIRSLRETLSGLRMRRVTLLLDLTEIHPDVLEVDEQIRAAEAELTTSLEQQHGLDPQLIALHVEYAGLQDRARAIDGAIERTTEVFSLYPDKMRQLSQLQLAATAAEEIYRSLQAQSYQIAVAEAMSASPIQFVETARRPERPVSPRLMVNTVIGFAVGLLVGLGLVAIAEYIDDTIRSPEDLVESWDAPQLAVVPRYKAGLGVTIASMPPTDPLGEVFRTLRSGIAFGTVDSPSTSLLVTSSLPSEGKSTVLANLGVAAAREGKRVLIVDCDLRRPSQHTFWQQANNATGLGQVLLGTVEWRDAVQDTPVPGLQLLSSGPVPPNPGNLVESLKLRQLLLELGKSFDVVLVDAPPALVVNDALLVANMVDHLLVVVESGGTPRRVLQDCKARLASHNITPLGLVLNKMQFAAVGYEVYAKAYKAYSDTGAAK
jgi:capsular exopolysaccharide synthesis family protein